MGLFKVLYDVFALLEEVVTIPRFKEIVNSIWHDLKIKTYKIITDSTYYEWDYLHSRNSFCEWPGLYLENQLTYNYKQQVSYLDHPPVKYKIKPFKTVYDAIADWLEIGDFRGGSDPRIGNVLIFLPNYKGMIKEIVCSKDAFELSIDGTRESLSKLDCQVELMFDDKIKRENFILEEGKSKLSIPIEIEPLKALVNIVTEKDERLDYYYEDEITHTGKVRFIRRAINKDIIKKINDGENDKIEFKPFVDLKSKDNKNKNKKEEILQTIVAFANTNGGHILVGVLDNADIEGIRQDLLKNENPELKNENPEEFIKKFRKAMRKFVSDNVNKGISLDFQEHEIREKIILEIKVEEGKEKPYADITNYSDSKYYRGL